MKIKTLNFFCFANLEIIARVITVVWAVSKKMTDNKIYLQSTSSDPSKQSSSLSHFHELWIHCSPVRHCHSVSEEQIVVLEVVQLDSSLWSLQSGSPSQYHSWSMHCLSAHWNSSAVQVKGAKEQREKKRERIYH